MTLSTLISVAGEAIDLSNLPDATVGNVKVSKRQKIYFSYFNFLKHMVSCLEDG